MLTTPVWTGLRACDETIRGQENQHMTLDHLAFSLLVEDTYLTSPSPTTTIRLTARWVSQRHVRHHSHKLSLGATCQELVWLHWVYQDLLSRGAFACKLAQRVFWEIEWNQLWYFSYLTSKQHWTPAGGDLWPSSKLKQQRGCWKCSSWVKAQGLVAQHV